jgi:hypothetical protein
VNQPPQGDPQGQGGQQPPTEEELRAAFEEALKKIRVEDVILQTAVTLVNLAARKLGLAAQPGEDVSEEQDLGQAKLAIEGVRALLPLCPPDQAQQIQPALSQLQMAFVQLSGGAPGEPQQGAEGERAPQGESAEDAERAKARAKLWTPPGA